MAKHDKISLRTLGHFEGFRVLGHPPEVADTRGTDLRRTQTQLLQKRINKHVSRYLTLSLSSCLLAKSSRHKLSEHEYADTDRQVEISLLSRAKRDNRAPSSSLHEISA